MGGYLADMTAQRQEVDTVQTPNALPSFRPVIEALAAASCSHAVREDPLLTSAVLHAESEARRLETECGRHALVVLEFAQVKRQVGPGASVEALSAALLDAYGRVASHLE